MNLQSIFGGIDIYLFDQLLRGRIMPGMRILDVGCGGGRNLTYLLREGFDIFGVDQDSRSISALRAQMGSQPGFERFRAEPIESMSFPDEFADVVIASAVLHFARDDAQFAAMARSSWRRLKQGGLWFCRLASTIGIEGLVQPIEGRRYHLPDGSDRYLVDAELLMQWTAELGGELLDPLKTTVVQDQRSMTTWVARKR